jgi:hypothetical protein
MGLSDRAILLVKLLLATILFAAVFAGVISYQARRIPHPVEMHMPGNRRALPAAGKSAPDADFAAPLFRRRAEHGEI